MIAAVVAKKSTAKPKAAAAKKAAASNSALPAYKDLIKECIVATASRDGVSRITIKKFVEEKYKTSVTPTITSHINQALARGAEKGEFIMPKG